MSRNEQLARIFASQFDPPLEVAEIDSIDGVAAPGAFICRSPGAAHHLGLTAIAHGGKIRASLEFAGEDDQAEKAGKAFAAALDLLDVFRDGPEGEGSAE